MAPLPSVDGQALEMTMHNVAATSPCFIRLDGRDGPMLDNSHARMPAIVTGFGHESDARVTLPSSALHIGFVCEGEARIRSVDTAFKIKRTMSFCIEGNCTIAPERGGRGFMVSLLGRGGTLQICGPMDVDSPGLLNYMDNATTNLLIVPRTRGDPCLNKLVFPPMQQQTSHTHASWRLTYVVSGHGICEVPDQGRQEIRSGDYFLIPEDSPHAIHTLDERMVVVTAHPTSVGPGNPMLESTILF